MFLHFKKHRFISYIYRDEGYEKVKNMKGWIILSISYGKCSLTRKYFKNFGKSKMNAVNSKNKFWGNYVVIRNTKPKECEKIYGIVFQMIIKKKTKYKKTLLFEEKANWFSNKIQIDVIIKDLPSSSWNRSDIKKLMDQCDF